VRKRSTSAARSAHPLEVGDRARRRTLGRGTRGLERRLGTRPRGALGRRGLERRGQPRPLALGARQRGGERFGALRVPLRLLEISGQPRPVGRRELEGRAQAIGVTAARRELGGEHGALGAPRRHLAAQLLAVGHERRHLGSRLGDRSGDRRPRRADRLDGAPAPHRLDHRRQLAERALERAHVALRERARRESDQHEAADRRRSGVQRDTRDGAHRRRMLDQARDVAVARHALDQVGAAVQEPVERHVPRRRVGAARVAQAAAALLGKADLRDQTEEPLPLVEEAEGAGLRPARLQDGAQRGLERILGRRGVRGDLTQPLAQRLPHRGRPSRRRGRGRRLRRRVPPPGAARLAGEDRHRAPCATPVPGGGDPPPGPKAAGWSKTHTWRYSCVAGRRRSRRP